MAGGARRHARRKPSLASPFSVASLFLPTFFQHMARFERHGKSTSLCSPKASARCVLGLFCSYTRSLLLLY